MRFFLPLASLCVFFIGLWQMSSKVKGKEQCIQITEEDLDYFVATVVDYLGDDAEWIAMVDSLSSKEVLKLYQRVEEELWQCLEKAKREKKVFDSLEEKDKWIVSQIEEIRARALENPRRFIQKPSKKGKEQVN